MMNSFGRQEGGGFRRREGKLVSPVRRDYPLHLQTTARRKREKKHEGRGSETPPKSPPPGRKERREEEEKKELMRGKK